MVEVEETLRGQLKVDIDAARREASKAAEARMRALRANHETVIRQRVQAAREGVEKKMSEAVTAERKRAFAEKLKLNEQLENMKREIERSRAFELGKYGELDLLTALTQEFGAAGDKLSRIPHREKWRRYIA